MTIRIVRSVECDAGCGTTFMPYENMTTAQLRQRATWNGWHSRMRTRDICPWCWEKGER